MIEWDHEQQQPNNKCQDWLQDAFCTGNNDVFTSIVRGEIVARGLPIGEHHMLKWTDHVPNCGPITLFASMDAAKAYMHYIQLVFKDDTRRLAVIEYLWEPWDTRLPIVDDIRMAGVWTWFTNGHTYDMLPVGTRLAKRILLAKVVSTCGVRDAIQGPTLYTQGR